MVAPGVYRSGYPGKRNEQFLVKLGLRSIMYVGSIMMRLLFAAAVQCCSMINANDVWEARTPVFVESEGQFRDMANT
jgi:hypothetical protein